MGWSNYAYFKKEGIVIEIGKMSLNDVHDDTWQNLEYFVEYMEREDKKNDVMNYLWDNCFIDNAYNATITMFLDIFKGNEYEIIGENILNDLKDVKVLRRK